MARGLSGVQLVTSDAHEGLKGVIAAVLHGATWQRYRVHWLRNATALVPKTAQQMVGATIRTVFSQSGVDGTREQWERVMLVTDALAAAELSDGVYELGGKEVFVRDGAARLADGTLASSTLTMDAAVRNVVRLCDVSLVDAVCMASTTPAESMGWGARKGRIRTGWDADLVVLDRSLHPIATWIGGIPTGHQTPER